jgi:pyridoxal phosphate enzyme (YggS family)
MDDVNSRLSRIRAEMAKACMATNRQPSDVRLLAVSKSYSAAAIRLLHDAGQPAFGENRLQEAMEKQAQLADLTIEWHFIGPIQSNKTREIASNFDWVQSVDRARILERLSAQRPRDMRPLKVCLQVNIDAEPQKAGVAPEQLAELAALAEGLPGVALRGLMCIPRLSEDPAATRASMAHMREVLGMLQGQGHSLDTLSMGMSGDFSIAIAEGSTMVRVGTDLFEPRAGTNH